MGLANNFTALVAILAILFGVGQPLMAFRKLWVAEWSIVARTEYYVMIQAGAKIFPVEEQRRMFAQEHPKLARWL